MIVSAQPIDLEDLDPRELAEHPLPFRSGPYAAFGHRFEVQTSDPELHRHVRYVLSSLACDDGTGGAHEETPFVYRLFEHTTRDGRIRWAVYGDDERIRLGSDRPGVFATLCWHVNRSVIGSVGARVALHAGCVAKDGRGVILPAPMESGKTTLVAGLLRRGLDYLSDEAAVIDPEDLTLHAYPKALSIDRGSFAVLPDLEPPPDAHPFTGLQWYVPVETIRPGNMVATAEPALIVSPRYARDGTTRLEEVSAAEAVRLLAENTFGFHDRGPRNLRVLADLVRRCRRYRLEIADLGDACDVVLQALDHGA